MNEQIKHGGFCGSTKWVPITGIIGANTATERPGLRKCGIGAFKFRFFAMQRYFRCQGRSRHCAGIVDLWRLMMWTAPTLRHRSAIGWLR
jgi:hypothetical protein